LPGPVLGLVILVALLLAFGRGSGVEPERVDDTPPGRASNGLRPPVPSWAKLKREEWNAYARHLSSWKRETTLDA
jgi:hypothetical protein